jgi:large subunit ribosomal protein L2
MSSLQTFQPYTPSRRNQIQLNYAHLLESKKLPLKSLTRGLRKSGGRNGFGRLTAFRHGGGHKRLYRASSMRFLPFGLVSSIEYDPNRTAFIYSALLRETGTMQYTLAPQQLKVGSFFVANYGLRNSVTGSPCLLFFTRVGDLVYNVTLPNKSRMSSAAGTSCKVVKKDIYGFHVVLKLPSSKLRKVSMLSLSYLGKTSNPDHRFVVLGKAGRSRWLGKRPTVRGVAMNPVDHPHGGGEGKSSGGRPSVTAWGFPAKGQPTRRKKSDKYLVRTIN